MFRLVEGRGGIWEAVSIRSLVWKLGVRGDIRWLHRSLCFIARTREPM
jgi:hypothetical protein